MTQRTFRWLRGGVVTLALLGASCAGSSVAPSALVPGGLVSGVWNPEDLICVPGTAWVVVSAMKSSDAPGALLAVDVRHPRQAMPLWLGSEAGGGAAPSRAAFAPHGIDVRATRNGRFELLVVDHGGGEAIDRFSLEVHGDGSPTVEFVDRILLPPGTSANAVAATSDGGFVMTSMYDPRDPNFVAKFAAAEVTGSVWRWTELGGWKEISEPRFSAPNGIALGRDGKSVIVAEWAARRLWRIPLSNASGEAPRSVAVPFLPDNLRWTSESDLLLVGQTTVPQDLFGCRAEHCPQGFVVARVNPETLAVSPIVHGDDVSAAKTGFGAATGAIQVGETIWVGSFMGKRLGCFEPRRQPEGSGAVEPVTCGEGSR